MKASCASFLLTIFAGALPVASAQRGPAPGLVEPNPGESIAWFGTLEAGRVEAARTGRPILFLSAAPMCNGVPGVW